jgi:hypothetical protein
MEAVNRREGGFGPFESVVCKWIVNGREGRFVPCKAAARVGREGALGACK